MRIILMLFILALLISGCSNIDKKQAMANCKFDAVKAKLSEGEQDNYTASCMISKGYMMDGKLSCYGTYQYLSDCWTYTWRVFL
jgi:hypothetical protein